MKMLSFLSQVPAAEAEEGCAIPPDEAHRGGECRQREDRPDPAADEAQALAVELEAGRCWHWRAGLDHQGTGQEENGAEHLGLLRLADI